MAIHYIEEKQESRKLGNIAFSTLSFDETIAWALGITDAIGPCRQVVVANAYSVVLSVSHDGYRNVCEECDLAVPDGLPVVWVSRLLGLGIRERIAGPDLMWELMRACEDKGRTVFFLGATESALRRLRENALEEFPRLQVVGACSPPFGDWPEKVSHKMIEKINSSRADVLLVGVSSPKQDCWIASYKNILKAKLAIGVGAAFDFHSGAVRRAPLHLQRAGLEWFHRLLQDPKRLWRRYLYGNMQFLLIVIRQLLYRFAERARSALWSEH